MPDFHHRFIPAVVCALLSITASCAEVRAQNSSLYYRDLPAGEHAPETLPKTSWISTPVPPPKQIRIHDIVSIRVEEAARMTSEGEVQRRKNASYNAVLLDWIRLIGLKAVKPAPQADGDPQVQTELDQLYRTENEIETRKSLTFNIAANVADIRPNGNLVLEAHRQIRNNDEVWEYSLTGICRYEDVAPGNVILSRDIADLRIDKRDMGHVRDANRRGWLSKWFDAINPF